MEPNKDKQEIMGRPPDEKAIKNKEPPKPLPTKRLAVSLLIKIAAIVLAVCSIAHKPRQTPNTARTVLTGTFSSFRNKSHTGRHAAKQGANLAVQLKNGFYRNSYRRFTVLYRSKIATNIQRRVNSFIVYFLTFSQQIAHREKYT